MSIAAVNNATTNASSTLGLQEFMKILMTQLTYQDPLKPMDNKEFMAQIAQFTTLQQVQLLNDQTTTLVNNQAALQSVGLIGRTVDFTSNGASLTGSIVALSLAGSTPQLTIQTSGGSTVSNVSLSSLTAVR